jgi:transposase InsO family protein
MMKRMGIEAIYRRPNTSKPAPGHRIYPYLPRGLKIERVNHVWAMDITYIPMARGFVCLAAVVDVFSRCVLSHRVSIARSSAETAGACGRRRPGRRSGPSPAPGNGEIAGAADHRLAPGKPALPNAPSKKSFDQVHVLRQLADLGAQGLQIDAWGARLAPVLAEDRPRHSVHG